MFMKGAFFMKAYKTPEAEIQSIKSEDIMAGSPQSYFQEEGKDNLTFNWSEFGSGF